MKFFLRSVVLVTFAILSQSSFADERVFTEYEYDQIGNTKSVNQDLSGLAPSINTISPAIVRQNQVVQVLISGAGLRGAQLSNVDGYFSFSNIQSSNSEITATLTVSLDAAEGPSQISVATGLGTAFASFDILAELPDLRISPIPVVIKTGSTLSLETSLSKGDVVDHDVSVSISDSGIASSNVADLSFLKGSIQSSQSIQLAGVTSGRTRLNFESTTLGNYSYDLTVTDTDYPLVPGEQEVIYSSQLGVNKLFTPPPPALVEIGPIISAISITKLFDNSTAPPSAFAVTNQIGLLKGNLFEDVTPNAIGAGVSNQTVTISGSGLQSVDGVRLHPETGATIHDLVVNPDGQTLTFQVDVAADVALSKRQLVLTSSGLRIPPKTHLTDRIYVGGQLPVINSTSPIYFNRGDIKTVIVLGQNFDSVRAIRFDNEENLIFSKPVVNATGNGLTFDLQIIGFARLGPRVLTLESLLGDGLPVNVDAAVIHIQDRPPEVITPVVSAAVGVTKQADTPVPPSMETIYSQFVGVHRGGILKGLTPKSRSQGSSASLTLEGAGLDAVAAVEFSPADGITVGDYIPSIDGTTATLEIDIAADANPSIRQVKLSNGVGLLKTELGADRFEVTLPKPQITSIYPLQIERAATGLQLVIRGELLNGASAIRFNPADDILVSNVVASADGREATATINVAAVAVTGPRVATVMTAGGLTESSPMVTNTITIVEEITGTVTPVISTAVGIVKEVSPVIETEDQSVLSRGVGILKEVITPPAQQDNFAVSQQVGVTRGPVAKTITPASIAINSTGQTIVVSGRNLDDVTTVRTVPAEGVTLNGPAVISDDGSSITFTADVADDAPQTVRRLQLETATDLIPFETLDNALIRVTGLEPEISSIEPIQEVRGASFTMTIRGINFVDVQSVKATPATEITFAAPSVAADGRSLTVQVFISATAATEQKVISVVSSAGQTTSAAIPANTFTVISN